MGGGQSAMAEMEELVACTFLLGKAITSVSYPDMFNLKDFHDETAPELPSQKADRKLREEIFGRRGGGGGGLLGAGPSAPAALGDGSVGDDGDDGDDGGGGAGEAKDDDGGRPSGEDYDYDHRFVLDVGDDRIVVRDVRKPNQDGWTALHACCHSHTTIKPGLQVLAEVRRTASSPEALQAVIDTKTTRGPGPYNKGWTPLHMAAAYGLVSIVEALVANGATVECRNSIDWSPILEAVHRGFTSVTKLLLASGRASLRHIPSVEAQRNTPFVRPPPTHALGEACRCGFDEIAKMLLDAGAPKDLQNNLGWAALHEAAFYNHAPCVRQLLVYGADATVKNKQGVVAYSLSSFGKVRATIKELGPPEAAPEGGDEPGIFIFGRPAASLLGGSAVGTSGAKDVPDAARFVPSSGEAKPTATAAAAAEAVARMDDKQSMAALKAAAACVTPARAVAHASPSTPDPLLHTGGVLGDLPSLSSHKKSRDGARISQEIAEAKMPSSPSARLASAVASPSSAATQSPTIRAAIVPDQGSSAAAAAAPSTPKQRGGSNKAAEVGLDAAAPAKFLCEICKKCMHNPMKTPYGNVYERAVIMTWINRNGSIDPLTGMPLVMGELKADEILQAEILEWRDARKKTEQERAAAQAALSAGDAMAVSPDAAVSPSRRRQREKAAAAASPAPTPAAAPDADLYDF